MKTRKGFTLIELLIVVVIIAVLAALILPRFINQPEKAMLAEAHMQLGAIRRAQLSMADAQGLAPATATYLALQDGTDTDWAALGLSRPDTNNSSFWYACRAGVDSTAANTNPGTGAGTCSAVRKGASNSANSNITISLAQGTYTCGSTYRPAVPTAPNRRGCI